ncbi:MAG: preprotein translocase subunit SecG [Candidatus Riflebacteria bacterium]|nr:preprotein translocase subunit SecG [Candidatus Riflebacteria bacterium]
MSWIVLLKILHGAACIILIVIVLLQADKGEGLSGAFGGGGGAAIFGKRGATGFFAKATAGAAIVFMLTSFWLGWKGGPAPVPGAKVPVRTLPSDADFPVQ